jgi:Protein of unknown function (DUF2852)
MVIAKLDEMGKLAWLAVILIAFWTAWPLGLAVLAYLLGSGRLRGWREAAAGSTCWRDVAPGTWFNLRDEATAATGRRRAAPRSGNQAFDEYREETLRRLEEEQREFQDYLERLRRARDKAEFDGFMAERRRAAPGTNGPADAGTAT